MQDVLSTSPIMTSTSRHQAASTPNTEDTKTSKIEQTNFYTSLPEHETNNLDSTSSLASVMAFRYRNNNFSVSNLANLDTNTQPQRAWAYSNQSLKPNHFNQQVYNAYNNTQYYSPTDLASNNFTYTQSMSHATNPTGYNIVSSSNTNPTSPKNSPETLKQDTNQLNYPAYNQLSSSQISSSSFNTTQSSNKSLSPKSTEFNQQVQSFAALPSIKLEQQMHANNVSSLSPMSSLGVSSSSIGNLSTSSSTFNTNSGQGMNTIAVNVNGSSGSLPGSSTESFEWMKPVKSQPNGKTRTKDKYRVVYTEPQRIELEKEFLYSKYITIKRKAELSLTLALSERQIKIWFQNRRAKDRKTQRKQRMDNKVSSTTRTSSEFGCYSNEDNLEEESDDEDLSDSEETEKAFKPSAKKSKKSTKASNKLPTDVDTIEKRQSVENAALNPYLQGQTGFGASSLAINAFNSSPPLGTNVFGGYNHQLNSTPNYNHYFNQESQLGVGSHCYDYSNYYQANGQAAPVTQGLEYGGYNSHVTNEQQYYHQQHLLLNGGSI